MRRRHSHRPHREGTRQPRQTRESAIQRLIVCLVPHVDGLRRLWSTLPDHLINILFAIGTGVELLARGLITALARTAAALLRLWRIAGERRRLRNTAVVAGVTVILAGAAVTLVALALTQEQPGWWRAMPPTNVTEQTGNRVQNEMTRVITGVRPLDEAGRSTPWGLAVNPDQANAWLNTKLREWIRTRGERMQWIDQIREVQVDFNGERIAIGARIDHQGAERIFSATLIPQVREDGSLWMIAQNVQIGRLSVPASWVLPETPPTELPNSGRVVPAAQGDVDLTTLPEAQAMFAAFSGERPMIEKPALRLPDGRAVRLLSLTTRDNGTLVVTCRTEMR